MVIAFTKPDRLRKFYFGGVMRISNFYSNIEDYDKTNGRRYLLICRMVVTKKRPAIVIEIINGYKPFTYKIGIKGANTIVKAYDAD